MPQLQRELPRIVLITGVFCVLLGLSQLALGAYAVPGDHQAAVDTSERFAGGIFLAYGIAWLSAARSSPLPIRIIRLLAYALLAGAAGRVTSLAVTGWPLWWQDIQLSIEIVIPAFVLLLTNQFSKLNRGSAQGFVDSSG